MNGVVLGEGRFRKEVEVDCDVVHDEEGGERERKSNSFPSRVGGVFLFPVEKKGREEKVDREGEEGAGEEDTEEEEEEVEKV